MPANSVAEQAHTHFEFVITCDWSAAIGRKPNPCEDRCWIAWGTRDDRSEPMYCPTRLEAEQRIIELLTGPARGLRSLVGFDFAIGYPTATDGSHVLPTGRELCAMLAERITDDASGNNNRFQVAQSLNAEIKAKTGDSCGPFWGRPRELDLPDLPPTRPSNTSIEKLRPTEVAARKATRSKPKSPWQLTGAGSVGSQSLVGLPVVHRLLMHEGLRQRASLWPFEEPSDITISEIYPSLFPERSPSYWYRDARQVVDARDAILTLAMPDRPDASEGWIYGLPAPAVTRCEANSA
ncbi:MAG: hypothetical protein AAGB51_09490 [Planctomycetota bacterium]